MSSEERRPTSEEDQGRPDLSEMPRLRSVEEVEQAARPGYSARERAAEDRYAEGETGDHTDVALPIPAPGGSRISGGPSVGGTPSAFGSFSVEAGPLQINHDDEDD